MIEVNTEMIIIQKVVYLMKIILVNKSSQKKYFYDLYNRKDERRRDNWRTGCSFETVEETILKVKSISLTSDPCYEKLKSLIQFVVKPMCQHATDLLS